MPPKLHWLCSAFAPGIFRLNESMIRFGFKSATIDIFLNATVSWTTKIYLPDQHWGALQYPAGKIPPSKAIQGVILNEVQSKDVQNFSKTCLWYIISANKLFYCDQDRTNWLEIEYSKWWLLSENNAFSLPRKLMILQNNEARIKREDQLIDVLNIELDVRDINPQNLSDFYNI